MNKKIAYFLALSTALVSGSAFAADLAATKKAPAAPVVVSPWDFDIGAGLTSDYMFRGITQSNHAPSVAAHGELRYNFSDMWQGYVGVSGESIKLTPFDPSPSMELDTYGGVRGTFGQFTTDAGVWGYLYPGLSTPTPNAIYPTQINWVEGYFKAGYNITDAFNVGGNFFYTPSYIATGADGEYLSATAKYTIGDWAISGELGRQLLGTTDATHTTFFPPGNGNYKLPSYTTWNVGASYTWKFVTLDLRYWGTSLSKSQAVLITGPTNYIIAGGATSAGYRSNYADQRIVGTISFDLTSKDLK